jgi:hypothetical protein
MTQTTGLVPPRTQDDARRNRKAAVIGLVVGAIIGAGIGVVGWLFTDELTWFLAIPILALLLSFGMKRFPAHWLGL